MWKQIIVLILLSVLVILAKSFVGSFLHHLAGLHDSVLNGFSVIFAGGELAQDIQRILAVLTIPLVAGALISVAGWLMKHDVNDYVVVVIWVLWLLLIATMTTSYVAATAPVAVA